MMATRTDGGMVLFSLYLVCGTREKDQQYNQHIPANRPAWLLVHDNCDAHGIHDAIYCCFS